MSDRPAHLLCVGKEVNLLELRCAVLQAAGYNVQIVSIAEAESVLLVEAFDLIVLSARMSEDERRRLLTLSNGTPFVALQGVTFPQELLDCVSRMLDERS